MFYLVILNSWQNRPKNVWHDSTSPAGALGSNVEAPPNWHQHWLRFSWMIQKCCGDTPDGSKVRHCSLFEHAWDSVKQCFFHMVQDFPRKSKLEGSTFEYICRFTSGPTTRLTPCAFLHHLLDDSKCQLDSHRPCGSKGHGFGRGPPFLDSSLRCPWVEADMEGAGWRFPIKQHMVPGCPRRLVSMVCKLLINYF